ncbi:MAG: type II toxin-antitoxin system RelE/ParE family toxin [Candidatus Nanohaloarchaea archaeon]|nr:type II toxin-antitoxin system RelE/ParE family toxin [Candidatus Nanohaloarchaea archaeon]
MVWNVIVSPQAEDDLSNFEGAVADRVKKKLKEIRERARQGVDPDHYLKWINKYEIHRLRIGDYRVFIDLDKEEKEINVVTVLHREDAYTGWG